MAATDAAPGRAMQLLAVLGAAVSWQCSAPASSAPASADPVAAVPAHALNRYLPLEHATVFRYETTDETGQQGLLVMQVKRPREDVAELHIAGRVQRLLVTPDGVEHVTGGFVLANPIRTGRSFRGSFGNVEIRRVGVPFEVPAGRFADCIETVEARPAPPKQATSVYCAGVGLVFMQLEGETEAGYAEERYRLLGHGPIVDLMQ